MSNVLGSFGGSTVTTVTAALRIAMRNQALLVLSVFLVAGCASSAPTSNGSSSSGDVFAVASTQQYVREFGTSSSGANGQGDTIAGIAQDQSGDVLVAGSTVGNLPGNVGTVGILKGTLYELDPSGNPLWAQELTTGAGDALDGVAVTPTGIAVVGDTLGAYPGMSNPDGVYEAFVAQYDASGTLQWLKQYTSGEAVYPQSLCTDTSGNLIFAGEIADSAGGQDLIVEKVDTSGNEVWQEVFGSGATDAAMGVAADGSGDIYAVGSTNGTFPGGGSQAQRMPFVLRLNGETGATVWVQQFSGESALSGLEPTAVTVDAQQRLDVVGQMGTYGTNAQIEVVQMEVASGTPLWNLAFGAGADNVPGEGVAVDGTGDVYVTGMTKGALVSGVQAGVQDIFLARISSAGAGQWAQQLGTGTDGPPMASTGATPLYLSAGNHSVVLGGMTAGAFSGFSNPNHDVELFVAGFGQ